MKTAFPGHKEILTYNAQPEIFGNAKALRKRMTKAEKILWNELRNRKTGKKFRR